MASILVGAHSGPAATLDQPVEHLLACHRRIEQRLETLERVVPYLWEQRNEALAAIRNVFAFMESSGSLHTEDEERSLFPRLAGHLDARQAALVRQLEADHRQAESLYVDLKAAVADIERRGTADEELRERYQQTLADLCELYRNHIQLEESRLTAVCRSVLSAQDQAAISAEMKARRGLKTGG